MKERCPSVCKATNAASRSFSRKPDAVVSLLKRTIAAGFSAVVVLMDSWFTQASLLRELIAKGLHVIGLVKAMKQRYQFHGKRLTLKGRYIPFPKRKNTEILGSLTYSNRLWFTRLVFVQNRNRRRDWLVFLSTDFALDDVEIVRIYGMPWSIETFFKFAKSYLKLGTEFLDR
jgi:hypothetical protein